VFLDEHLSTPQIAGAALVMAGLAVNVFGGWLVQRVVKPRARGRT